MTQCRAFAPSADARLAFVDGDDGASLSQRVFGEGGFDFCFVSHAADDPVLPDHRAHTPFARRVQRQRWRGGSTLMHQHHRRMPNPQLLKMGVFVTGSGAAGEVGLTGLGLEGTAFYEPGPVEGPPEADTPRRARRTFYRHSVRFSPEVQAGVSGVRDDTSKRGHIHVSSRRDPPSRSSVTPQTRLSFMRQCSAATPVTFAGLLSPSSTGQTSRAFSHRVCPSGYSQQHPTWPVTPLVIAPSTTWESPSVLSCCIKATSRYRLRSVRR